MQESTWSSQVRQCKAQHPDSAAASLDDVARIIVEVHDRVAKVHLSSGCLWVGHGERCQGQARLCAQELGAGGNGCQRVTGAALQQTFF